MSGSWLLVYLRLSLQQILNQGTPDAYSFLHQTGKEKRKKKVRLPRVIAKLIDMKESLKIKPYSNYYIP